MRSPGAAFFAAAVVVAAITASPASGATAPAPQAAAAAGPGVRAPVVRARRDPRPELLPRLAALPSGSRFRVNGASGALSRLRGRFAVQGADLPARGADFARRFGPLFDGDEGTAFGAAEVVSRDAAGRPAWVRLRQHVRGFPLAGHALMLRLDGADEALVREAHGVLRRGTASVAPAAVDAGAARATALAHLQLDEAELMAAPVVAGRAQLAGSSTLQLVQRVELVTRAGLRPLAVDVDAHTGAVLAVRENRSTGAGNLLWDGVALPFVTGKGKGNVYTSVANALAGKESASSLAELTLQDVSEEALALTGTLTGRYATVWDFDAVLFSPQRSFPFSDASSASVGGLIAQYEAFDHVNAYHWITRMAAWLGKVQGGLASDTCLPVIVNYDDGGSGYANAFYSPQDLDGGGGGFGAGYFVFGDLDAQTGDPHDDFSRDPSVVCHEYTHGLVDKAGFTFGDGALDTPSRAVNEALADYAAASFLKDGRIGPVFMAHAADDLLLEGEALRDLRLPLTLPGNLHDAHGGTGLPEEHEAGEIFGAALWSARTALKPKVADRLILDGLAAWPQDNAEAGFPVVDAGNADEAYAAYFFECFEAMMDELLAPEAGAAGGKQAGRLLGAFLRHGITGTDDDAVLYTFADADEEDGLAFAFTSEFLGGLTEHRFALELAAGQSFTLSVKGDKADATQVDFATDDAPGDFLYPEVKKQAADGTSASQAKITVANAGTYVITVSDAALTGGRYTLKLKLK